jgi:predicted nucleotidyltransferase
MSMVTGLEHAGVEYGGSTYGLLAVLDRPRSAITVIRAHYPLGDVGELQEMARRVGANERTLRRAVELGTVRAVRPSPRRLEFSGDEQHYLQRYWPLLLRLRRALRTEPAARLAVLFGSTAVGDASPSSDIDLLIGGAEGDALQRARLAARLERASGGRVHLLGLDEALASPSLLADVLADGRVLVDRDRVWPSLKRREPQVRSAAMRQEERTARRAADAVDQARARRA